MESSRKSRERPDEVTHPVNILSFELGRNWRALEIIEIQAEIHVTRFNVRVFRI